MIGGMGYAGWRNPTPLRVGTSASWRAAMRTLFRAFVLVDLAAFATLVAGAVSVLLAGDRALRAEEE